MSNRRLIIGVLFSRRHFLLAAAACATQVARPTTTVAAGARPGKYCIPLGKGVGDLQYDFELNLLDGNGATFRVSDWYGSPIWLTFFASWCPPCNSEAGDIVDFAKHYAPQGLRVAGIDVHEKAEAARIFRDRHRIPFPIALDETGSVFNQLGFIGIPTQMFLDRTGRITCAAMTELTRTDMDNEIAVALESRTACSLETYQRRSQPRRTQSLESRRS